MFVKNYQLVFLKWQKFLFNCKNICICSKYIINRCVRCIFFSTEKVTKTLKTMWASISVSFQSGQKVSVSYRIVLKKFVPGTHSAWQPSTAAGEASLSAGSHTTSRPPTPRHPSSEPPGASSAFWTSATSTQCGFSGITHTSVELLSGRWAASDVSIRINKRRVRRFAQETFYVKPSE